MQTFNEDFGFNWSNSLAHTLPFLVARVDSMPVAKPKLGVFNKGLAQELGLNVEALQAAPGVAILSGSHFPQGTAATALAYAGHQFGHFAVLGDGRALLLGEHVSPSGARFDIQLKGSGPTPFSRGGDGRASLGPMLREYILSEAMHALGIPTTRSLAVVSTGDTVWRTAPLPGAVLTRVAQSHLRIGTFEYVARRGDAQALKALADYAIERHYPEHKTAENPYKMFLLSVIERQARLIALWQSVGFIHGVMNTDNMTISGETIDYGPCAFIDNYSESTAYSSIDRHGRYAYGNQPSIAQWNLARLAETLLPLLDSTPAAALSIAEDAIAGFSTCFQQHWLGIMAQKIGIRLSADNDAQQVIASLFSLMEKHGADFTNTFWNLEHKILPQDALGQDPDFQRLAEKLAAEQATPQAGPGAPNPRIIARNHRVEEALRAAVEADDFSVMERLLSALAKPFADQPQFADLTTPPRPEERVQATFCGT